MILEIPLPENESYVVASTKKYRRPFDIFHDINRTKL